VFKSLRINMILIFSIVILYCGITISINIFNRSEAIILSSVGEQARSITERAAQLLSNDEYAEIVQNMVEDEHYFKLREELNAIREMNGLKYLYTIKAEEINGETIYTYVLDGMPLDAEADDISHIGDIIDEPDSGTLASFANQTVEVGELDFSELYGATITTIMPIYNNNEFLGVVGADFDASNIYIQLKDLKKIIIITLLIVLATAILLTAVISTFIVGAVRRIVKDMKRISEGDLTVYVKTKRKDEIGQLADMFNNMSSQLRQMILTIKSNLDIIHQSISILSSNITASNELSIQVSQHLDKSDKQTEEQHGAITQTSRSLSEVEQGMTRVATTAEDMLTVANKASQLCIDGTSRMEVLSNQMSNIIKAANHVENDVEHLTQHSQHINEILQVMKNITSQTGLLALNASIEAARAGEHGKGFNVVAQQIRKLAEQSKDSAEQVSALIHGILETTVRVSEATALTSKEIESGSQSVIQATAAFQAINKEVANVTIQANELSATSEEIEATTIVVSQLASDVTVIADESLKASKVVKESVLHQIESVTHAYDILEKLKKQSDELAEFIKHFKLEQAKN